MSTERAKGTDAADRPRGNSRARLVVLTVLATLAGLALAALGIVYSGVYDIGATSSHIGITRWLLSTTADRSIAARAASVPEPPPPARIDTAHGFIDYHEMCVTCHGAPGIERSEIGKGLNPKPPDLAEEVDEFDGRELFWITKNGIRMAGMPAFGPTHSDDEIWGIVAILERLPEMTPEQYSEWAARYGVREAGGEHGAGPAGTTEGGEAHVDAPGTPPHTH